MYIEYPYTFHPESPMINILVLSFCFDIYFFLSFFQLLTLPFTLFLSPAFLPTFFLSSLTFPSFSLFLSLLKVEDFLTLQQATPKNKTVLIATIYMFKLSSCPQSNFYSSKEKWSNQGTDISFGWLFFNYESNKI